MIYLFRKFLWVYHPVSNEDSFADFITYSSLQSFSTFVIALFCLDMKVDDCGYLSSSDGEVEMKEALNSALIPFYEFEVRMRFLLLGECQSTLQMSGKGEEGKSATSMAPPNVRVASLVVC